MNTNSYTKGSSTAMDPLCQKHPFDSDPARNKKDKSSYEYESNNLSFCALLILHNCKIEFNSSFRNPGTLVKEPPKKENTGSNDSFADVFASFAYQFSPGNFKFVSDLP